MNLERFCSFFYDSIWDKGYEAAKALGCQPDVPSSQSPGSDEDRPGREKWLACGFLGMASDGGISGFPRPKPAVWSVNNAPARSLWLP